jgi:hypothetical protein
MPTDHVRYDILAQNALRGVVRTVMADAAKKGLIGDHHFKISFDTTASGVKLPQRLHEQYPQEMTIVLQHQFWDLEVSDEAFEVGLSFGGIPERLRVPFEAIVGFFDPSVNFGLQFTTVEVEDEEDSARPQRSEAPAPQPAEKKKPSKALPTPPRVVPSAISQDKPDDDPDKPAGGAEVVRLDRFRKK